ncbi:MAG TPA: hypothetical protein VNN80_08905 [Polyangiaceae bacterium]|nr:hypothetical protein [Polyangiaceae bacterium]
MRTLVERLARSATRARSFWLVSVCFVLALGCAVDPRSVGVFAGEGGTGGTAGVVPCQLDCPEVACPADDVCRDYAVDRIPAGNCNASGGCATPADCAFSWRVAALAGVGCDCGEGGCRLTAGVACTRSDTCSSASCFATNAGKNLCCAVPCAADQACTDDGTGCEPLQACEDGTQRCSDTSYQQCTGGRWVTLQDCGALGCDNDHGGCLRAAGQTCEADADCGAGKCLEAADGARVCCSAACDVPCQRCAPSGTECAPIEDDAACGSIACPLEDPCRLYDAPSVETQRCVTGACATPDQVCTFSANVNAECNPTTLCDDAGNCSRPKLATNAPCQAAAECQSGACVVSAAGGSVCCSSACAPTEQCGAAGTCEPAPVCEDGATRCSGSSFQRCMAGQWALVMDCGAAGCSGELGRCLAGAGGACQSDADCGAGSCLATAAGGSVCCTADCGGACRRCAASGLQCEPLDDDESCGDIPCPADTECRDFPASVSAGRCIGGRCGSPERLCVGSPVHAGLPCGDRSLCDTEGECSQARLGSGRPCTVNGQCLSGFCADGMCCNEACDQDCEACNAGVCEGLMDDNACDPVPCSTFDATCVTNPDDITTNRCRAQGVCKDRTDCGFLAQRTLCNSLGSTVQQLCDGQGRCNPVTLPCGGNCETGLIPFDSCCAAIDPPTGMFSGISCIDTFTCTNPLPSPNIPIRCYDNADCSVGNVCCLLVNTAVVSVDCTAEAACTPIPGMVVNQPLCGSPTLPEPTTCSAPPPITCTPSASPQLAGFAFCQ